MNFSNYMMAKEKKQRCYAEYDAASQRLVNAGIHERLAEIKSQHEPLATLITKKMSGQERLYAIAYYVVIGRFPEEED